MNTFDDLKGESAAGWPDNNLEQAILKCDWMLEKIRNKDFYAQNLYAAICNNQFVRSHAWNILKEDYWSASWRYAGGMMATMQGKGDYLDFYCSGSSLSDLSDPEGVFKYVREGCVTEEIEEDLKKMGWLVIPYPDNEE